MCIFIGPCPITLVLNFYYLRLSWLWYLNCVFPSPPFPKKHWICFSLHFSLNRLSLSIWSFAGPLAMAQCHDFHHSSRGADFKPLWHIMWVASIADAGRGAAAGRSAALALCLQVAFHNLTTDDLSTQVMTKQWLIQTLQIGFLCLNMEREPVFEISHFM